MKTTYSIGQFSQITGLSPKTLRFYHEKGILVPSSVDDATGYRFYDADKIEKARVIMRLRQMEFSIEDIAAIFAGCDDEANILDYLERQKATLQQRITEDRDVVRSLTEIITKENEARRLLAATSFAVEEKSVDPMLVAGLRMTGRYHQIGEGFSRIGKAAGRYINGRAMCLYYDGEYRDDEANFEPCFPVRKEITGAGVTCHELPAARCLSLIHRGPYEQLGRSYAKVLQAADERKLKLVLPSREIYVKGPGMIFKGKPSNYLTEIQLPFGS